MARPQSIEDDPLIERLAGVFRDSGYEGASLAALARATGLRKSSLYHRFPGGKREMAEEVLSRALAWMTEHVITVLSDDGPPRDRVGQVAANLNCLYDGGRKACFLNLLAAPDSAGSPFAPQIRAAFEALIAAFARPGLDAGQSPDAAAARSERAVAQLHGSLVMTRGLGDARSFRRFLAELPDLLLD